MTRSLVFRQNDRELTLHFEVPAPEVDTLAGAAQQASERVISVRTPLSAVAKERLNAEPWDLVIWSNARGDWTGSETFVRNALELRAVAGPAPVIWAPRVALPGRLALLRALGIDLVDTTEGLVRLAEGVLSRVEGPDPISSPAREGAPRSAPAWIEALERDYLEEDERVRRAVRGGRLRELVESRLPFEPVLGEMVRYLDRDGYALQEEHTPVRGEGIRPYGTKEAQHRPEMERFRRRFLERYRPPPSKRLLVIVPCSRTKPYSRSPSHRRFWGALEAGGGLPGVHLVSVTSPLGLVPRELESVYPAAHYDIPVTGDWDEEERTWVRSALTHLLSFPNYEGVLVHLPKSEMGWLSEGLLAAKYVSWTVPGQAASARESLGRLSAEVQEFWKGRGGPPSKMMVALREEFAALARFQFGEGSPARLFEEGVRLMGRPWFHRLVGQDGTTLATWKEAGGLWRLTSTGAKLLADSLPGYLTEVRGGIELQGDLFAPGALRGGSDLRPGDETILVREGQVLGVGEALVPGSWMGRITRGMVVKVRHRAHEHDHGSMEGGPVGEE
jgi:archaeosine synthase